MRHATLLALLLLALLPAAAAQAPKLGELRLEVDAFAAPLLPLQAPGSAVFRVEVDCTVAIGPAGLVIDLAVEKRPTWSTVVLNPPQLVVAREDCGDDRVARREGTVLASASDAAPYARPTELALAATTEDALGSQFTAEARTEVEAAYFGILDIAAPQTISVVAPGETAAFTVQLQNLGNGATRVEFSVADSAGLDVVAPQPLTLEARQQAGARTAGEATLRVATPDRAGSWTVSLAVTSMSADDAKHPGDAQTVSFVVQAKDSATAAERVREHGIPGASPLALVAVAFVVALRRRRH